MRPVSTFFDIQLSNSRGKKVGKPEKGIYKGLDFPLDMVQ